MKSYRSLLIIMFLLSVQYCGFKDDKIGEKFDEVTGKALRIQDDEHKKKFNTAENPGKWKTLEGDHVPVITLADEKGKVLVQVQVPFRSNPDHYTEFIILADARYKEISKISYAHFERDALAEFVMPPDRKGLHYIIIKCNLHDMWMKDFIIPERDRESRKK